MAEKQKEPRVERSFDRDPNNLREWQSVDGAIYPLSGPGSYGDAVKEERIREIVQEIVRAEVEPIKREFRFRLVGLDRKLRKLQDMERQLGQILDKLPDKPYERVTGGQWKHPGPQTPP